MQPAIQFPPGTVPRRPCRTLIEPRGQIVAGYFDVDKSRFDDLFNFVHDPATLIVAFGRVARIMAPALPESTA